ncbi:GGDEF domain-containing protein [Ensifer soli]|uniref:GGDEF domain-containing protein n=1 Tax=Ciceribacter sp. sgz301302 TaxID=3342379 RepID=UPI0035B8F64E
MPMAISDSGVLARGATAGLTADPALSTLADLVDGLAASEMAIALFDPADRLMLASPAFRSLYDVQPGEQSFATIITHCHAAGRGGLIVTDDIGAWLKAANGKRRRQPHRGFEVDLVDGRWFWAQETTYNGGWILLTLTELTRFKLRERDLETARDEAMLAADTDTLTGLNSRRAIVRYLDECVRLLEGGGVLSVALIDIDHFKQINDTFGHDMGDRILERFGDHCRQVFGGDDVTGRVGGEEFLLVMPGRSMGAAIFALQRFQRHILRANHRLPQQFGFSFSAGVSQWLPGQTRDDLYHAADRALYTAKANGRNCIATSEGAPVLRYRAANQV